MVYVHENESDGNDRLSGVMTATQKLDSSSEADNSILPMSHDGTLQNGYTGHVCACVIAASVRRTAVDAAVGLTRIIPWSMNRRVSVVQVP